MYFEFHFVERGLVMVITVPHLESFRFGKMWLFFSSLFLMAFLLDASSSTSSILVYSAPTFVNLVKT